MKQDVYILVVIATLLAAGGCSKDEEKVDNDLNADIKEYFSLHNKIAAQFETLLAGYDMSDFDMYSHSDSLLAWIGQQPEVTEVNGEVAHVYFIRHTNGLEGSIIFNQRDPDVSALFVRGGGAGSSGTLQQLKYSDDDKLLTNEKMLIVLAHASDFYAPYSTASDAKHIQDVVDLAEGGKVGLEVTLRVNEGISAFRDISDYGFIIVNTHGGHNGSFSTGQAVFSNNLIAFSDDVQVADIPQDIAAALRDNDITITSYWDYGTDRQLEIDAASYDFTFEYVQAQNWQFDNAVWLANYCFSGEQYGRMGDILATKGVKSFYCYNYTTGRAERITNDMAWRAEDTIIKSLLYDIDTTGIAHLANSTTQLQDDRFWNDYIGPTQRMRMATRRFIFGPQTLNHYLDKGYHYEDCSATFTDNRDQQEYESVCIGDQTWMAENLNWAGAGKCYDDNAGNCNTYGRLYNITELTGLAVSTDSTVVQGLCPEGWHVPSEAEFQELIDFCGGATEAADKLRSAAGWPAIHSDAYGFNLLAAGHYTEGGGNRLFRWIGEDAKLWTSSPGSSGLYVALSAYHPALGFGSYTIGTQDWYFSCRCIKD